MLICDTHADTLYAMQSKEQKPLDVTLAALEAGLDTRVQAFALFVGSSGLTGSDSDLIDRELNAFRQLQSNGLHQIRTLSEATPSVANGLLTIEGGEAFGDDIASVERYAGLGVRIAGLVWNNENLLAHPAVQGVDQGLSPLGLKMVDELRKHRIALDLSHLNQRGAWEVMDSSIPPMASHSCARALFDHPRNLTDEQLRALFMAGGYVGVNFYPLFLTGGQQASIDDVVNHIVYMCELGGEKSVGLGSDFDGIDCYPDGLRDASQLPNLFEGMRKRKLSEALIAAVAGQNFARYMNRIDHSVI
ncbi:MAG: membrane dipeptidase [Eubacteriales bacterium]|nr:membrane dipeptidase [Eubacteriales bacterium]